uniref:Nucleoside phosphorylase domain-containing protein n=1 Tax=Nelumbo nucifera TaxID=4432 RepID=A0A822ZUQ5_NELNU|nr:TPA_asm: hypothetical protein HUJ06_018640 [Nelumbo nucifera]
MAMKKIASSVVVALLSSLVVVCTSATPLKRRRSLGIIGQLNHEGPYLGLLTVYPPEEEAFFATGAFEPHPRHPFIDLSGRRFRIGKIHGKRVVYVRCGIGMVRFVFIVRIGIEISQNQNKMKIGFQFPSTNSTQMVGIGFLDPLPVPAFGVSSTDMESVSVVMTSLSNGFPVIVIRGLSDLAGGQTGRNTVQLFGPLAALNTAKVVIGFIKSLP